MLSNIINNIIFARPNCEADWADNRGGKLVCSAQGERIEKLQQINGHLLHHIAAWCAGLGLCHEHCSRSSLGSTLFALSCSLHANLLEVVVFHGDRKLNLVFFCLLYFN